MRNYIAFFHSPIAMIEHYLRHSAKTSLVIFYANAVDNPRVIVYHPALLLL